MKNIALRVATSAIVLVLAACGGDSGGDMTAAPATDAIPAGASQSSDGMVAFLSALAKDQTESGEPLSLAGFMPPASDAAEPLALP